MLGMLGGHIIGEALEYDCDEYQRKAWEEIKNSIFERISIVCST